MATDLIDGIWLSTEQSFRWLGFHGAELSLPLRVLIRTLSQRDRLVLPAGQVSTASSRRSDRLYAAEEKMGKREPVLLQDGTVVSPNRIAWLRHAWDHGNREYGPAIRLLDALPPTPNEAETYHLLFLWTDPVTGRKVQYTDMICLPAETTEAAAMEIADTLCEVQDLPLERLRKESPCPA